MQLCFEIVMGRDYKILDNSTMKLHTFFVNDLRCVTIILI